MPYIKAREWADIQQKLAQGRSAAEPPDADRFADLKRQIKRDAKVVKADIVANDLLNKVCIPFNCRESAFIMEKGESVRTQPFRLVDSEYNIVSLTTIGRVLKETKVDEIEWTSESYDCDDIARKFVTRCADLGLNSVGRVMSWSGGHAFCVAIVKTGGRDVDFVFIEPQTDEIIEPGKGKYSLENALIVIS